MSVFNGNLDGLVDHPALQVGRKSRSLPDHHHMYREMFLEMLETL